MILGCIIYPSVLDSERVKEICETSSKYHVGKCEVRWAYILAVISIFDILILSILALVLSRKQISNFKISTIRQLPKMFRLPRFSRKNKVKNQILLSLRNVIQLNYQMIKKLELGHLEE